MLARLCRKISSAWLNKTGEVSNLLVAQQVFVQHLLELEKGGGLVPADVPQVIGAATPQVHRLGVPVFLDIYLVKGAVSVILDTENDRSGELIMFHQFNK